MEINTWNSKNADPVSDIKEAKEQIENNVGYRRETALEKECRFKFESFVKSLFVRSGKQNV